MILNESNHLVRDVCKQFEAFVIGSLPFCVARTPSAGMRGCSTPPASTLSTERASERIRARRICMHRSSSRRSYGQSPAEIRGRTTATTQPEDQLQPAETMAPRNRRNRKLKPRKLCGVRAFMQASMLHQASLAQRMSSLSSSWRSMLSSSRGGTFGIGRNLNHGGGFSHSCLCVSNAACRHSTEQYQAN
jgi:hypothetical protein